MAGGTVSYKDPSEAEAAFYDAILTNAIRDHAEQLAPLVAAYYDDDPVKIKIGFASGDRGFRASFTDGPNSSIRVEYGRIDEHDHFTIIEPLPTPHEGDTNAEEH